MASGKIHDDFPSELNLHLGGCSIAILQDIKKWVIDVYCWVYLTTVPDSMSWVLRSGLKI